jgi:hypothetical protein
MDKGVSCGKISQLSLFLCEDNMVLLCSVLSGLTSLLWRPWHLERLWTPEVRHSVNRWHRAGNVPVSPATVTGRCTRDVLIVSPAELPLLREADLLSMAPSAGGHPRCLTHGHTPPWELLDTAEKGRAQAATATWRVPPSVSRTQSVRAVQSGIETDTWKQMPAKYPIWLT